MIRLLGLLKNVVQIRSRQLWFEASVQAAEERLARSSSRRLGSVPSAENCIVAAAVRRWGCFSRNRRVPVAESNLKDERALLNVPWLAVPRSLRALLRARFGLKDRRKLSRNQQSPSGKFACVHFCACTR